MTVARRVRWIWEGRETGPMLEAQNAMERLAAVLRKFASELKILALYALGRPL